MIIEIDRMIGFDNRQFYSNYFKYTAQFDANKLDLLSVNLTKMQNVLEAVSIMELERTRTK